MKQIKNSWRVNEQISAPSLRVIGSDAKQIGVMTRAEALAKAKEMQLDLVEVVSTANPPVAKIVEFGKFRYQEEKKQKKEFKKNKGGELKEIRFSPFIAENDYNTRMERIREFLDEKNKVRVVVVYTGRQMNSKQFGYEVLGKVVRELGDRIVVDMEPKFLGRRLNMVISPTNKPRQEKDNAKTKDTQERDKQIQDN